MKFTKNYGLKKPEQTDFYDVVHENANMDILDEKLNEASHYQGNLSSTYDYDEGFVFSSDGDESVWENESVWEIPRALKVVYSAVCNLASNGVEKNKNRVDKMEQVISRASNTWIIPDYLKNAIHYVCGAGTPEENGYSADDYNDENGYDEPYLDVISGTVYHAIRTKDSPLTYGWVVKERLTSVQDAMNAKASKNWICVANSGYLTTADWKTVSSESISSASEVMLVARWFGNALETLVLPIAIFRSLNEDDNRALINTRFGEMEVKYVTDSQIQVKFNNTASNQYINLYVFIR